MARTNNGMYHFEKNTPTIIPRVTTSYWWPDMLWLDAGLKVKQGLEQPVISVITLEGISRLNSKELLKLSAKELYRLKSKEFHSFSWRVFDCW